MTEITSSNIDVDKDVIRIKHTTWKDDICFRCKHFDDIKGCEAFPEFDGDVPDDISSTNKHDKPIPGQKNNIVFEPISEAEFTRRKKGGW